MLLNNKKPPVPLRHKPIFEWKTEDPSRGRYGAWQPTLSIRISPFELGLDHFKPNSNNKKKKTAARSNLWTLVETEVEGFLFYFMDLARKKNNQLHNLPAEWWDGPREMLNLGEEHGDWDSGRSCVFFSLPNGISHFIKCFAENEYCSTSCIRWMCSFLGSTQMNQPHTESVNCWTHIHVALFFNRLEVEGCFWWVGAAVDLVLSVFYYL